MPSQPPPPPPPPPRRSSSGDDPSQPPPPKLKSTASPSHGRTASASILKPPLVRVATGNSVTFADHKASRSAGDTGGTATITLERLTSAQFEDEATTHIIAALEADDLMGEGIEDYSDDDEANASSEFTPETTRKERTYSTDSFIKNLQKHGDLQQYRISPLSVNEQHRRSNSEIASQRYHKSMMSAGFLPGVPDGSAMEYEQVVSSFFGEDSEEDFVEGVKEKDEEEEKDDDDEEAKEETTKRDPMDATDATKNLTTMGERLKLMQRQGSSTLLRTSLRSSRRSLRNAVEGSGDQLLNALSNGSKRKETKGFWKKIQYEYTNLIAPQLSKSNARISRQIFFVTFPGVALACLLYYIFQNPMAGDTGTSLFWQQYLDVFTEINPVSGVTDAEIYLRILFSMMFVGVIVSLKRLLVAIYLGRRTVAHFGQELETLMAKMILIGEVAQLAKEIENRNNMYPGSPRGISEDDEKVVQFKNMVKMDTSQGSPGERRHSRTKSMSPRPNAASPHRGYESSENEEKTKNIAMHQSTNTNVQLLNLLDEW
eukprot:scaffold2841_cov74-Cyclotella_meneghiniana.AAC.9